MLTIMLGEFSGDNRELIKNVDNWIEKQCEIYGQNTLLTPTFLLNYSADLLTKNYVYVPSWDKYYYIAHPLTMMKGARCIIVCNEDVRMTYSSEILNLDCYVVRNEKKCNTLMVDSYYPAEIMSTLCTLKFDLSPFTPVAGDRNIVMCVYGGNHAQV